MYWAWIPFYSFGNLVSCYLSFGKKGNFSYLNDLTIYFIILKVDALTAVTRSDY